MKMPKAWITAGSVTAKSQTIDMSEEVFGKGLCPSCRKKMVGPVFCGGRPMQVCWEDRVALPYRDEIHHQILEAYKPFEKEEGPNVFGR